MTQIPPSPELPEYPSPTIVDSRRLTGPNLYSRHPGVVLEVRVDDDAADRLVAAWRGRATSIVAALGWPPPFLGVRRETAGATLFAAAPVSVLLAATEVNEQAWAHGERATDVSDADLARLRDTAAAERATRSHLNDVYDGAVERGINATFDDEALTLGSGAGGKSWPLGAIPRDVPWAEISDVPIVIVTGSNGKTTTTRLIAAMWRATGKVAGWSCSDGVQVGDDQREVGDYAGPGGARTVLRDQRVQAAVLETARGGILRRGLAVTRADAAIITNISADHFGEYGIASIDDLAQVKGVVASVLGSSGRLVLNADDAALVALATRLGPARLAWFSMAVAHPALDTHVTAGGDAATIHEHHLMLHLRDAWHDLGDVRDMPITLNGSAAHNIENLLGAALLGAEVGIPVEAIRATVASFGRSPDDNPGRLQMYRFGGVTVLVDYAHNPDGLRVVSQTAAALPAQRRLLIVGQAGNREDEQIRELVRAALAVTRFDRIIVKEMPGLLRGRARGEISNILTDELNRLGVSMANIVQAETELDAFRLAFEWAEDGDVLVCPAHIEQAAVKSLLGRMGEEAWRAGHPVPVPVSST